VPYGARARVILTLAPSKQRTAARAFWHARHSPAVWMNQAMQ